MVARCTRVVDGGDGHGGLGPARSSATPPKSASGTLPAASATSARPARSTRAGAAAAIGPASTGAPAARIPAPAFRSPPAPLPLHENSRSDSLPRQSSCTKRPGSTVSVDHFRVSASGGGTQVLSRLAAFRSFENTRWKYLSCGWLIDPAFLRRRPRAAYAAAQRA